MSHGSHESDFEGFDEDIDPSNKKDGEDAESDFEGFGKETTDDNVGSGIIADIFGESDEEEDFEGFAENEVDKGGQKNDLDNLVKTGEDKDDSSSSDDEILDQSGEPINAFVSDFDTMMDKQKALRRKFQRRGRNIEIINDSDDFIIEMIGKMKNAADDDRELIGLGHPAVKKLKLLPEVVDLLKKADMRNAQIDCGILRSITEWLSPLPDKSIPSLPIREAMLKNLLDFPSLSSDHLKDSGIGKAVMFLLKHPKETRKNKEMAAKLINQWSRPIFNLTTNYKSLTKEEREERDYANLPKKRNIEADQSKRDINKEMGTDKKSLRPGDAGFVARARVPQPSHKDYVVRPKWNTEKDEEKEDDEDTPIKKRRKPAMSGVKKEPSRIEKHMRSIKEAVKQSKKVNRAVNISLEGRKMAL